MARRLTLASLGIAWVLVLLLAAATPVLAHHKGGHDKGPKGHSARDHDGDADSDRATAYTEDNDGDGHPNAPDPAGDSDNRHPSGKDRHEEGGKSGNQGRSESDPDDDGRGPDRSNGGPDKPNGSGGVDQLDQDGNNGCGNDDDFEDDNEGWCGKPPAQQARESAEVAAVAVAAGEAPLTVAGEAPVTVAGEAPVTVGGKSLERANAAPRSQAGKTEVLGVRVSRGRARAAGGVLPFTGAGVISLIVAGCASIAVGLGMVRRRSG